MRRILVALDTSPRAPSVLAAAAHLARSMQAKLVLFRAVSESEETAPDMRVILPGHPDTRAQEHAVADLRKLAAELEPTLVESVIAKLGPAALKICNWAEKLDVDLVVIGAHGYRLTDRILGTTSARVVNNCARPVFVVRSPEDRAAYELFPRQPGELRVGVGTASGVVAGAAAGMIAGPPGAAVGAILGGAAGALAGAVLRSDSEDRHERHSQLDEQLGISGGDIGAKEAASRGVDALEKKREERSNEELREFERSLEVK
jgi:nucleotide-binding universal stress UspA family protein